MSDKSKAKSIIKQIKQYYRKLSRCKDPLGRKMLKEQIKQLRKTLAGLGKGFVVHVDNWLENMPERAKGLGSPTDPLPDTVNKKKAQPGVIPVGAGGAGAGRRPLVKWRKHPFFKPKVKKGGKPGINPFVPAGAGGGIIVKKKINCSLTDN